MAISKKMLARGNAVGLSPEGDESSQAFSARVRKAENEKSNAVTNSITGRGRGR